MACNLPSITIPAFPSLDDLFAFLLSLIPDLPDFQLPELPCPLD